ncbi:hypothetical protein [Saccharomonospora cyanea]|uniref:Uncharacterized protein n=1 Tax=Saccharomonospora cyanea NA-134 TaxID=882082 RepID=H5XP86_9PSEU|nr:hypothetical protein [Saccharomonospora cyanea]EHR63799.1 hypothetical protein SaccyDRAFT_5004 [Saccharomonospora cyanea NA-134]
MGQPPGWYPQQPRQYPPQQPSSPYGAGWPQQPGHFPQPGHPGAGPRPASPAMAYTAAALFVPAIVMAVIAAVIGWSGVPGNEVQAGMYLSLFGLAFAYEITGNVDFAIAATVTLASTTAVFTLLVALRVNAFRWLLAVVGVVAVAYHGYAVVYLLGAGVGGLVVLPAVTLLFWVVPTLVVMLPPVGRAMRRSGQQSVAGAFGPGYGPGH